jgi:hypothetical protein
MLAATGFASAALLLARSTVIGPGAALHSSLAVAATGLLPTTVVGTNATENPIGAGYSGFDRRRVCNCPRSSVVTGVV